MFTYSFFYVFDSEGRSAGSEFDQKAKQGQPGQQADDDAQVKEGAWLVASRDRALAAVELDDDRPALSAVEGLRFPVDADGRVLVGNYWQINLCCVFALDLVSDLVRFDQGMQIQGLFVQVSLVLEKGVPFFGAGPGSLRYVVIFAKEDLVVELVVVVLIAQELEGSWLGAAGGVVVVTVVFTSVEVVVSACTGWLLSSRLARTAIDKTNFFLHFYTFLSIK